MKSGRQDRRKTDSFRPGVRYFADELLERAWPSVLGDTNKRQRLLSLLILFTLGIDYVTGPTIRFPAFYAPAILLFAWYDGFLAGSAVGIGVVTARFILEMLVWPSVPWPLRDSLIDFSTSSSMLVILSWFTSQAGRLTREVQLLWGILPICMYCHRIRGPNNHWEKLELYLAQRSSAEFTHGICPFCMKEKHLS